MAISRRAAAELPHVDLGDALAVCVIIREAEPDRFERAALRWLARFCVERREATLAEVQAAAWAFENSAHELFAVMRPANERAEKLARRLGMQWVGETDKYYDLRLQVFRLRPPELLTSNNG